MAFKNPPSSAYRWAWAVRKPLFTAALLFSFILIFSAGFWLYGPIPAHAASIADIGGSVEVAANGGEAWGLALPGTVLRAGDRIRTNSDGNATLVFFEGTRISLEPDSEVAFTHLSGQWGDVLQVELAQKAGVVHYTVIPLRRSTGEFTVNTPGGMASVRGTKFSISVRQQGQTLVMVDTGKVVVSNANAKVDVLAGEALSSSPGVIPGAADFRFSANSTLLGVDGNHWQLSKNITLEVNAETLFATEPHIGQTIFVAGRINKDHLWLADLITVGDQNSQKLEFAGLVQVGDGSAWMVNGIPFGMDDALTAKLKNGDRVFSELALVGGERWEITKLVDLENGSEVMGAACVGVAPQPKAQKLAEKYSVAYDDVKSWFCQGFGFGEIDLAYGISVETNTPIADIFDLRRKPSGWGEIKSAANTMSVHPTITDAAILATQTSTLAAMTATASDMVPAVSSGASNPNCTGADPQPEAQSLASDYGVEYDEIMGWFCEGYGFGEIKEAYDIKTNTGSAVDKLFAMKKSGLGWGEIQKIANQEKVNNGNNSSNNSSNNSNNGTSSNNGNNSNKSNKSNNGNTDKNSNDDNAKSEDNAKKK
ncbi:MAG: FecR family protein [Chloroflexi bacterium]|nr:FecR family protein [Chloroflexota bacterium]